MSDAALWSRRNSARRSAISARAAATTAHRGWSDSNATPSGDVSTSSTEGSCRSARFSCGSAFLAEAAFETAFASPLLFSVKANHPRVANALLDGKTHP
jgi:hypothetical protein